MYLNSTQCLNDYTFGPVVEGCRDNFDFTAVFEQIFFSIIPSAFFILLGIIRIRHLGRKPRVLALRSRGIQTVKLVCNCER